LSRGLSLEDIQRTFDDYPYWELAKRLSFYLEGHGLITLPKFEEEKRYKKLRDKDEFHALYMGCNCEENDEYPPLTDEEKIEYHELHKKREAWKLEIDKIYKKLQSASKDTLYDFNIKLDSKIASFKPMVTSKETLNEINKIFGGEIIE